MGQRSHGITVDSDPMRSVLKITLQILLFSLNIILQTYFTLLLDKWPKFSHALDMSNSSRLEFITPSVCPNNSAVSGNASEIILF